MRVLKITRKKSFVGCAAKLKVYMEDAMNPELDINGIPCRKIGVLKNNETAEYEVPETPVKIFVIADTVTKEYCNDYYQLPEGSEPVALFGKPHFNPVTGNAFIFEGNTSPKLPGKKKNKGLIVFISALIVGVIVGFTAASLADNAKANKEKTFEYENMKITLTEAFGKQEISNFNASYSSKDIAVYVLKEEKTAENGFADISLDEYAELVISVNGKDCEVQHRDGLTYFSYVTTAENSGKNCEFRVFAFDTEQAFWIVQFASMKEGTEDKVLGFAESVVFG